MPSIDHADPPRPASRPETDLDARYKRIGIAAVAAAARYAGPGRNDVVAEPGRERKPTTDEILLLG